MNKFKLVLLFVALSSCKKSELKESRFLYYEPISTKTEAIEIVYISWAATDRPNFVTVKNYNTKYNDTTFVNSCFYLDTKNRNIGKFSAVNNKKLKNRKTIKLTGRYYKTKRFDSVFPYKEFKPYSFTPKDGYFTVFVYETIE